MLTPDTAISMLSLLSSVYSGVKDNKGAIEESELKEKSLKIQTHSLLVDFVQLQIKSTDRIISWAEQCISQIGLAVELYVDDEEPDRNKLKSVATCLSALTDQGRLLLPNTHTDSAFGGLANRCIDAPKLACCVLTSPDKIRNDGFAHQLRIGMKYSEASKLETHRDYQNYLIGIRRAFVNEVNEVTNPTALNDAIDKTIHLIGNSELS